jgi:hypothetical protein
MFASPCPAVQPPARAITPSGRCRAPSGAVCSPEELLIRGGTVAPVGILASSLYSRVMVSKAPEGSGAAAQLTA